MIVALWFLVSLFIMGVGLTFAYLTFKHHWNLRKKVQAPPTKINS